MGEVHPGTLRGAWRFTASGSARHPITIRGVGGRRPTIDGAGVPVTGEGEVPRALIEIAGDHYLVERLDLVNARNGRNAAGIRCLLAGAVAIRDCRIADCDMGVCGEARDLEITDSEIGGCGAAGYDGYSHNVYVAGERLRMRGCWVHDAPHGQNVKIGSRYAELIANRIMDADDGEMSAIDGPGCDDPDANLVLIGNLVAGKRDPHGNTHRFLDIGSDGGPEAGTRRGTVFLINNTFVAGTPRAVFINQPTGAMPVVAINTIFAGSDEIAHVVDATVSGSNNWVPPTARAPAGFTDPAGRAGDQPGFVDLSARDARLARPSACIDRGAAEPFFVDGAGRRLSGIPAYEPPPAAPGPRAHPRTAVDRIDVGAYEFHP